MAARKEIMGFLTGGVVLILASLFLLFTNFIMSWLNFAYLNYILGGILVILGFMNMKSKKGLGLGLIVAGLLLITGLALGILKVAGIIGLIAGIIAIFIGIMKVKENT